MSAGGLPCLSLPALLPLSALLLIHSYALSPPQFTTVPVDQIGVSGAVVSFVCQATGDPKPQVSWRKKGKKVNSKHIQIIPFDEGAGTVLRIEPLRALQDQNTYECVAENSEGVDSVSAKLSVIAEDSLPTGFPNIYLGPQLKVVELNRLAVQLCAARGNPDPKITWFKDFLPIDLNASHGRFKQLHFGALQINNSQETDQGKYECMASNVKGVHYSSPASLYVRIRRMPPHFTILPTSHEITAGGSVNITCVAVGSPVPYVKWMLNSEDLTPEDETPLGRNVLELNSVRESANYTCVAMSSLGIIEAVAQVTVTSQPKTREQAPSSPPRNVEARIISANTMAVRWDKPEEPNGQINGYRVYYTMDPSQDTSHWQIHNVQNSTVTTIQSLVISETYTIHVLAFTSVGDGLFSDPIHVKVLQRVLGQPTIGPGPESEPHTDLIARFMSFLGLD